MNNDPKTDDEATLIGLRFALADVLELCEQLSPGNTSGAAAIEQAVRTANLHVMLLLKMAQKDPATEQRTAPPLSTAA